MIVSSLIQPMNIPRPSLVEGVSGITWFLYQIIYTHSNVTFVTSDSMQQLAIEYV